MKITGQSIGEAAYAAYSEVTEGKNYEGEPLLPRGALPERLQSAWQIAAAAAIVFQRESDQGRRP